MQPALKRRGDVGDGGCRRGRSGIGMGAVAVLVSRVVFLFAPSPAGYRPILRAIASTSAPCNGGSHRSRLTRWGINDLFRRQLGPPHAAGDLASDHCAVPRESAAIIAGAPGGDRAPLFSLRRLDQLKQPLRRRGDGRRLRIVKPLVGFTGRMATRRRRRLPALAAHVDARGDVAGVCLNGDVLGIREVEMLATAAAEYGRGLR